MQTPSPAICPFGEKLQKYWDKRYAYFSRFDEGIQIDAEGLYSVTPEEIALQQAKLARGNVVLDGFTGVGGNAIAFARIGKKVIAIEMDAKRFSMAKYNAEVYGVSESIKFVQGDFLELVASISADTLFLDPPWGGPAYKGVDKFLLEHFSPDGNKLLEISLQFFDEIIFKLPTNFDTQEFKRFPVTVKLYDDAHDGRVISRTAVLRKQSA